MKVLAFAGSNSHQSINKALVSYATTLLEEDVEILDINDYEMPVYSVDRESEEGIPKQAQQFYDKIGDADALVISFAEHNGFYTAAYKNLFDWTSRINQQVYQGKQAVLLATSPGPGGASNVLNTAEASAGYYGMDVKATLSVPGFYDNFDMENARISNTEIQSQLETALATLS